MLAIAVYQILSSTEEQKKSRVVWQNVFLLRKQEWGLYAFSTESLPKPLPWNLYNMIQLNKSY